jgi:hypothetical protein
LINKNYQNQTGIDFRIKKNYIAVLYEIHRENWLIDWCLKPTLAVKI